MADKTAMKRFLKPSISWQTFERLVPPEQRGKFLAFKAKNELYLRRVQASPEAPPKIDWDAYKKSVPVAGLVEKLKTAYEKFNVPYPDDTLSATVDEQWTALQPEIKAYCDEQQKIIDKAIEEIERIKALPDFDDITMEMFYDMYPDLALDPVKRPTFWPHTEDEQIGYVPPEQQIQNKK